MDSKRRDPDEIERDRQVDRLLSEALDRPSSARQAFIEQSTAGDESLRRQVLHLLRLAESEDDRLATGSVLQGDVAAELFSEGHDDDRTDDRIGPYRLVRPLGRGGSATVYLGERADGRFEQRVAIKILHAAEGPARSGTQRFAQECRILAALEHPGIASLLDGGTTDWGRPYLVVELVDGEPIDRFCSTRNLSLHERLERFLDVAAALQYAHRHLIVHRDIKPSNILVTAEGRVKLLDFGIAKLLDPDDTGHDPKETKTAALWLTPRYASPEQLLGEPITTASDVYQLGLLLYELITGRPAFGSTATSPSALVAAARERESAEPARVTEVPDDLNAIVMTATRPEPELRYATVALLADDVQAFLERRPVRARGDSVGYRLRRFVDRHRLGTAMAGLITVSMIALAAALTWGLVHAERERKRAEAIGAFLKKTLASAQPYVAQGRDTALLEEILSDAAGRIDTELADQPRALGDMHVTIAETLRALSDYETAERHARLAVDTLTEHLGPNAVQTLHASQVLGLLYWELGRNDEAASVLQDVLDRARRELGARDPLTVMTLSGLGLALRAQGRLDEAEPLYRQAMELSLAAEAMPPEDRVTTVGNLAFLLMELGRLEEAEPLARQAVELSRRHLGSENPDTYLSIDKLASLVAERGRLEEALELHREAHAGLLRLLGERHSTTLGSAYATATVLRRLQRYDEGIELLTSIVPIVREDFGSESRFLYSSLYELGRTLLAAGRPREALPHLEESCAIAESLLTSEHYLYAVLSVQLADGLIETGNPTRARAILDAARPVLEATFGSDGQHRFLLELARVEAKLSP